MFSKPKWPLSEGAMLHGDCDRIELLKKQRETVELRVKYKARQKVLESVERQIEELQKNSKDEREFRLMFDVLDEHKAAEQALVKAKREREEVLQKEAEIERLTKECAELAERKQKLLSLTESDTVYKDFTERVCELTKFTDGDALTSHIENLLYVRKQLFERENEVQEEVQRRKKAQLMLESQHEVTRMQKTNQLSQLHVDYEKIHSEAQGLELQWKHIQETAAKKILEVGQIKMATLSIYEMTGGKVGGEDGVGIHDTEKQLDKIKKFFLYQSDIMKRHQASSQRLNGKKHVTPKVKKT